MRGYLFVVSTYAPTDCSAAEAKDGFCRGILHNVRSADIAVIAGDFTVQNWCLTKRNDRHVEDFLP